LDVNCCNILIEAIGDFRYATYRPSGVAMPTKGSNEGN